MASHAGFSQRAACAMRAQLARQRGFSLIEVLAVVLLTVLVIGVTASTYVDLSRATLRATEGTRQLRHAMAVLERVSRDVQAAMLVLKPPDADPLSHPWLFLGESQFSEQGSDQIKFMTRGRSLRRGADASRESDFEVVTYQLVEGELEGDEFYELRRWSSPRLPESLEREFPPVEETQLVAENVERFELRFLDGDGEWQNSWDSSQLEDSSALPLAVEIEVALFDEYATSVVDEFGQVADANSGEVRSPSYRKMVVLPLRPIDLAARLEPGDRIAGGGEAGDAEGEDGEAAKGAGFGPELPGGGNARERPDRTIADCVVQPLPDNCLSLGESRILGQPFQANSRHLQALIECGATVQPACR